MASKKDNEKLLAERHQLIIQELLRDEDNKYCVDCDAKGPRWASWNIGVFLCIRCAGIHRNLGVHISKVKSVNLDIWTLSQLAMMRDMGNSRARAIYEARLPDNFRRPQTDSALESFIRAKYEQKRYIALEYVPTPPDVDSLLKEIQRLEQASKKQRHSTAACPLTPLSRPTASSKSTVNKEPSSKPQNTDLLGLNITENENKPPSQQIDFFAELNDVNPISNKKEDQPKNQPVPTVSASSDLFDLYLSTSAGPLTNTTSGSHTTTTTESTGSKVSKDAILALYNQTPNRSTSNVYNQPTGQSGVGQFPCDWSTNGFVASSIFGDFSKSGSTTVNSQTTLAFPDFGSNPSSTARPSFEQKPEKGWQNDVFDSPGLWANIPSAPGTNIPVNRGYAPNTVDMNTQAHQAYLSKVQSQLASMQLGGSVNHP